MFNLTNFFLKPDLIPKITFIKTKGIVIYHGKNNGGNDDYCEKRTNFFGQRIYGEVILNGRTNDQIIPRWGLVS